MVAIVNGKVVGDTGNGYGLSNMFPVPQPKAPVVAPPVSAPIPHRPVQPLSAIPAAGWSPQGGPNAGMGLADIINGPQFGQTPPMPQAGQGPAVPPVPTPNYLGLPPAQPGMPSPQRPQQNFNQLGQAQMAQILAQQGS